MNFVLNSVQILITSVKLFFDSYVDLSLISSATRCCTIMRAGRSMPYLAPYRVILAPSGQKCCGFNENSCRNSAALCFSVRISVEKDSKTGQSKNMVARFASLTPKQ